VWATTLRGLGSLGLASPDAQGRVAAVYDVPPALTGSIRRLLVTLEPDGGSRIPTGRVVLAN
jgi:anti-sigma-K factor RskA